MRPFVGVSIALGIGLAGAVVAGEALVAFVAPQPRWGVFRDYDERSRSINVRSQVRRFSDHDTSGTMTFDAHGLRWTGARLDAPVRLLVVGDSFTFGWRLDDDETVVARLQQLADAELGAGSVALLNAGHPGWGASDYVRYVEFDQPLEVDAVVVLLNLFDLDRSISNPSYALVTNAGTTALVPEPPLPRGRWRDRVARVPGYNWLLESSHAFNLVRRALLEPRALAPRAPPSDGGDASVTLGRALFERLRNVCASRHTSLWVLTTGFFHAALPNLEDGSQTLRFVEDADSFFSSAQIPYSDLSVRLSQLVHGSYAGIVLGDDPHPNARGARLVAGLAWPRLRQLLQTRKPAKRA